MIDKKVIITGGKLIDVETGKIIEDSIIIIENGKIIAAGSSNDIELPAKTDSVIYYDARGKTVLPGLIDSHTHLQLVPEDNECETLKKSVPLKAIQAAYNAEKTLEAGFTTIRDLGAEHLVDIAVRDAIEGGLSLGPKVLASGYKIAPTGADFRIYPPEVNISGQYTMDSVAEIRRAVRELIGLGVDQIKIMTSGRTFRKSSSPNAKVYSLEEVRTAVEIAHDNGLKVSAHAHGAAGVKLALEAGCDTIEHGTVLDENDIEFMLENNIYLVPTFSYSGNLKRLKGDSGLPDYSIAKAFSSREKRLKSFYNAYKAGVKIAMGSDSGMPFVPHGTNAIEITEMVKAGMSNLDALKSATIIGAEALGIEDKAGSIRPGKQADLIIVDGDPIDDIEVLNEITNIKLIIKSGEPVINRGEYTDQ